MAAPRRFALIPAAGTGLRFGGGVPKQYVPLAGSSLLRKSIDALNDAVVLESVFVVLACSTDGCSSSSTSRSAGCSPCLSQTR
jgi:2-C-methyl-D-erythritol 4-phosphate cytidylyltransferase